MVTSKPPLLLLTVDVEEDMPGWQITDPVTLRNVEGLPRLADLCASVGVKPTFLCNYPVATDPRACEVIRGVGDRMELEVGTHMHPWNTPPFDGFDGDAGAAQERPYLQHELGGPRFRAKLEVLHAAITELAGREPTSYRAGRFGIDGETLRELVPMGYRVDSSVTPLEVHYWTDGGPDFRSAPLSPYRPDGGDPSRRGTLDILEIPVSVGLTRRLPGFLRQAFVRIPRGTHLRGLLSRDYLDLIDFAWLYPVRFDLSLMKRVARTIAHNETPVFNVFLHSSELVPGASGRDLDEEQVEKVFTRLRLFLEHCREEYDAVPMTLTGAADELCARVEL